jgi:hypothetical protein
MQIKTTLRFHLTPVRITIIKTPTRTNIEEDEGKKEPSYTAGENGNKYNHFLKKINIDLPFDPAILLLRIYTKECNTGYSKGICTPMFVVMFFTIAKL